MGMRGSYNTFVIRTAARSKALEVGTRGHVGRGARPMTG